MEVFFSRPGKRGEIKERLVTDIKYAEKRLLVSAYSFTDPEIAEAIIKSTALDKRIVYNYEVDLKQTTINGSIIQLIQDAKFIEENCASLGSNFSKMHHKFIVTDDVLWTGTHNLSFNASHNNWENMIRVFDQHIIKQFVEEFDKMFVFSKTIKDKLDQRKCTECGDEVEDPFEHFRIRYLTRHTNTVILNKDSSGYYSEHDGYISIPKSEEFDEALNVSSDISYGYRADCIKGQAGSSWAECYKCGTKGIKEHMPMVLRRVRTRVKREGESDYHNLGLESFDTHPDLTSCLECLHSVIIEESKMKIPDSTKEIHICYFLVSTEDDIDELE